MGVRSVGEGGGGGTGKEHGICRVALVSPRAEGGRQAHNSCRYAAGAAACNTQAGRSAGGLGANMFRDESVEGLGVRRRVVLAAHLGRPLAARGGTYTGRSATPWTAPAASRS